METRSTGPVTQNRDIITVVLLTALILSLPLVAMQFSDEVKWTIGDFSVAAIVLITFGLTFVFAARKTGDSTHRLLVGGALLAAFLYVWAELAVGVIFGIGS